jgi:hypothetical protein
MVTVRVRIPSSVDRDLIVPLAVPDQAEVRQFALHLHTAGRPWQGEVFGWSAEYTPESPAAPPDSKMRFSPASFWIGESGIWFYSLMWEHGGGSDPREFLDDRGIVK